jgi:hypothetical protein
MPRTTLQLEGDAIATAKAHARRHGMTLGEAVSDLVPFDCGIAASAAGAFDDAVEIVPTPSR